MTTELTQRGSLLSPGYGNPGAHEGEPFGGIPIARSSSTQLPVDERVQFTSAQNENFDNAAFPSVLEAEVDSDTRSSNSIRMEEIKLLPPSLSLMEIDSILNDGSPKTSSSSSSSRSSSRQTPHAKRAI